MLKAQRFWSKNLKDKVNTANEALKTKNFTALDEILEDLMVLLQDVEYGWKDRVAICFILEQMAAIDPLVDKIIDVLMKVLESEKEPHVKEFAVWALGKIVEDKQSLELIRVTMPTIMKFLEDDSEQVKQFAQDLHGRLQESLREKEQIDEKIQHSRKALLEIIEEELEDMKKRSDVISKAALGLDYKAAFERQNEFKDQIQAYNELNEAREQIILTKEAELIEDTPAFKGESLEIVRYWRKERGEKEDLIRRIECIIRIQSKIHKIIEFIMANKQKPLQLQDIQKITTATGRPYSEKEVVEILKQLVDEEIVPNFMLEQIKDYQIKAESYLGEEEESQENDSNQTDSKPPEKEKK